MKIRNCGILASISWNSNKWAAVATEEDVQHSNYNFVKENKRMHEDLNFAHELPPCEEDGTFIAYTPMFTRLPSTTESQYVEVVFFSSLNYHINENCIVGFYAFPYIDNYDRNAEHQMFKRYNWGNVAALPEHIVLFDKPVKVSDEIIISEKYLPPGKKLGQQGFNYLF